MFLAMKDFITITDFRTMSPAFTRLGTYLEMSPDVTLLTFKCRIP